MRKIFLVVLFLSLFFITGCDFLCEMIDDSDHCYKFFAELSNDAEKCDKIESVGPKSKCLMMIAKDTGVSSYCDDLPTGFGAYSKSECIQVVAIRNQDPALCDKIGDYKGGTTDVSPDGVSKDYCKEQANKDPGKSECGWNGQGCCQGYYCKEEFVCTMYSICTTSCGNFNENCCYADPKCKEGYVCTADYICKASCGKITEKCCLGRHCDPGLECRSGGFDCGRPCGKLNTECCQVVGDTKACDTPLKCVNNKCVA